MPSGTKQKRKSAGALPPPSGFLLTCDAPTKQFIRHLNDKKTITDKFILEDLDATHLLVDGRAREEIMDAVEKWMDSSVFSVIERVGENLET